MALVGTIGPIVEIEVEEPLAEIGRFVGYIAGEDDLCSQPLACRQHAGIAGLLEATLREVAAPHVDAAAEHGHQRHDRGRHQRHRIAGTITSQPG